MGITARIEFTKDGKKAILLAISVGSNAQTPEAFKAVVDELYRHLTVTKKISSDDKIYIIRGCLIQGFSLKFKYGLKDMHEAYSLAIHRGKQWEEDCDESISRLREMFKEVEIIRWVGDSPTNKPDIYAENENYIVKKTDHKFKFQDQLIDLFDVQTTDSFQKKLHKFASDRRENKFLDGLFTFAVGKYWTDFATGRMHEKEDGLIENNSLIKYDETIVKLPEITQDTSEYIACDVVGLSEAIKKIVLTHVQKDPTIILEFIYPFPKENHRESATMQVLEHDSVTPPEIKCHLNFPKLSIVNSLTREEQKRIALQREAKKKEILEQNKLSEHNDVHTRTTVPAESAPSITLISTTTEIKTTKHPASPAVDVPASVSYNDSTTAANKRIADGSPPEGSPLSTSPIANTERMNSAVKMEMSQESRPGTTDSSKPNDIESDAQKKKGLKLQRTLSDVKDGRKGNTAQSKGPQDGPRRHSSEASRPSATNLNASMQHTLFAPQIKAEEIAQHLALGRELFEQVQTVMPAVINLFPHIERKSLPFITLGFLASANEQARNNNLQTSVPVTPSTVSVPNPNSIGK